MDESTERPGAAAFVLADDPGSSGFALLAESHRRAGRLDEARRVAEAGLQTDPQSIEGRVALGLALMDLGEPEVAREVLAGALPLESEVELVPLTAADSSPGAWSEQASPLGDFADPSQLGPQLGMPDDLEIDRAFDEAESDESEMMDVNRVAERVLEQEMHDFSMTTETRHEALDDAFGASFADGALVATPPANQPFDEANRTRILATFESWLQNIRRPVV